MLIRTNRLILRDYTMNDADNFYRLKSNRLVWNYSTYNPINELDKAKEELEELIRKRKKGKYVLMALFHNTTGEFIGEAGIIDYNERLHRGILECHLLPQYWNQGFATEIIKGILKYTFDVQKMNRIEARTIEANKASCKVLSKCGFLCEGTMRSFHIGDQFMNVNYFALNAIDYKRIKSKLEKDDVEVKMKTLAKQV
jgi:ribosomal-protein-alanine N-acetyltransferase